MGRAEIALGCVRGRPTTTAFARGNNCLFWLTKKSETSGFSVVMQWNEREAMREILFPNRRLTYGMNCRPVIRTTRCEKGTWTRWFIIVTRLWPDLLRAPRERIATLKGRMSLEVDVENRRYPALNLIREFFAVHKMGSNTHRVF